MTCCDHETRRQTESRSQSHDDDCDRDQEKAEGDGHWSAGGDKEQDGDRIESLKMSSGDGGFLVVTDGIVVGPEGHCWSDLHMDVYESTDWVLCEFGGQEQLDRFGTVSSSSQGIDRLRIES